MIKNLHKSITLDRLEDAIDRQMFGLDNPGFCITCGDEVEGCEPDAERYPCDECGTNTVYAPAEILIRT